jgi:hypothetical protein
MAQQILWENKKLSLNISPENVDEIIDWARKSGFSILSVLPVSKNLEDIFLEVVRNE